MTGSDPVLYRITERRRQVELSSCVAEVLAMNLISLTFAVFFIIVLATYHLVKSPDHKYLVIAAAACIFYGWGSPLRVVLLFVATTIIYIGGLLLERAKNPKQKRIVYIVSFALTVSILIGYKILNYRGISLPVGLSFYIFQAVTYLHDVDHGKLSAEHNFVRLFAFVSFFPSVLSGPIQKARYLLPQLREPKDPDTEQQIHGFLLFVWGMFVKTCVADRLSGAVAYVFDAPGYYNGLYHLAAAMLFSIELYADFAGYSDMAIGTAAMLGLSVERNFDNPFLSVNLKELWNRWHVSLNDWFIENVYFPLGGSRMGTARKYANIMVVFLISGLWHGQGLHFVIWGIVNGILLVIGEVTGGFRNGIRGKLHIQEDAGWFLWIRRLIVFLLFSLAFIFFRAGTVEAALVMLKGIFTIRPWMFSGFYPQQMFEKDNTLFLTALFAILFFLFIQYERRGKTVREENGFKKQVLISKAYQKFRSTPVVLQMCGLAVLLALAVFAVCSGDTATNTQFIYFAF